MTNYEKLCCLREALIDGADRWEIEANSPWGLTAWFSTEKDSYLYPFKVIKRIYEPLRADDAVEDTGTIWFHDEVNDGTGIYYVNEVGAIF